MSKRKSGGFVYKRYAAETQNTVNIISNVCVSLVFKKFKFISSPIMQLLFSECIISSRLVNAS